jgi:hypothetical protein
MGKIRKNTKIAVKDILTPYQYIDWLKENKGIELSIQGLYYQLKNTDNMDYVEIDNRRYIVMNEKAISFTPRGY